MEKPLIAVPRWKAPTWERTGYYLDSLEAAGARCQLVEEKRLPASVRGLLLMGGVDVNPNLYGEQRGSLTDKPHEERDTQEMRLLQDALGRDIPVLAICRGHQLLNVTMGGSLLQNIDDTGHKWHEDGESSWHEIAFEPTGRLADVYGPEVRVNSRHHQGITRDRLAEGLRPVAASHDDFVEAMESKTHRWVVGVQWHPERPEIRKESLALFQAFASACRPD
ncbi:MAG: gamma-glutamyl-gamma-aminobutyrate hydrolase family protein [Chloroflexota bacterium]|nr:gamma-glutamyl-gamma-aminobutyrate hydrolase family protein [Chloroflexota bacterium]